MVCNPSPLCILFLQNIICEGFTCLLVYNVTGDETVVACHYNMVMCGCYLQDGTVKLWDYKDGVLIDDIDCIAHLDDDVSGDAIRRKLCPSVTNVDESACRGADVRCLECCNRRKLLAVSFDG